MSDGIGVITVREIFRDLRNHSSKLLLLQNDSVRYRSRLKELSQQLSDKKVLLRFKNQTEKCRSSLTTAILHNWREWILSYLGIMYK